MSTKVIDKENASGVNLGRAAKGVGSNACSGTPKAMSSSTLLTPKVKGLALSSLKETTNTAKKRAFGVDLLNTNRQQQSISIGKTPKALKTLNLTSVTNTPSGLCKAKAEKPAGEENSNLEPVEHFIGNKYDDYADLYDSRIFEMLDNMRSANAERAQSPIKLGQEDDKDYQKMRRKVKKIEKKQHQHVGVDTLDLFELDELEAPTLPSILEASF
jgi:hypothetical protein